jgi:hypothetical protein
MRGNGAGTCRTAPGEVKCTREGEEYAGSLSVAPQAICDLFGSSANASRLNYTPIIRLNS